MTSIVIPHTEKGVLIANVLYDTLVSGGKTATLLQGRVIKTTMCGGYTISLLQKNEVVDNNDSVLLIPWDLEHTFTVDCCGVAVVPSLLKERFITKQTVGAVSYGRLDTDTFNLSSQSMDSVVVSLQRTITDIKGNALTPMELPMPLLGADSDIVLAVTAALLVSGLSETVQSMMSS